MGKLYVNRGISGQTTPQMLVRFRQDVINLKPSVVVILAGINDIAGNTGPSTIEGIADNIMSMAELAKANNIKVVLCSVLPAFDFPWRQGLEPAEKVVKLNALLKSYAEKHNFVYVDYFTAMANESNGLKNELGNDGVHPNATGYSIMEPLIQYAITEALSSELVDPTLSKLQNQFLNNQAEALLSRANKVFSNYPPNWPETEARKSALLLLDGVLHDVYAPLRPPVKKFLKTCLKTAVAEIDHTEIISGAQIWKLYNHGFLIKTKSVTIGFDLVRGKSAGIEGFSIGNEDMLRLINQCDVLFISHRHGDHADVWVAQSFIDQGKPVVAPPEVWRDKSIYDHITHLNREPHTRQTLSIQDGQQDLKVVVYPGHQNLEVENNVYLVITPENLSFSQMGDQYNDDDFEWIDEVGNNHVVDVLMPNCWTADIARVVKGFNPTLIITGHENEMGHTIDHREPY